MYFWVGLALVLSGAASMAWHFRPQPAAVVAPADPMDSGLNPSEYDEPAPRPRSEDPLSWKEPTLEEMALAHEFTKLRPDDGEAIWVRFEDNDGAPEWDSSFPLVAKMIYRRGKFGGRDYLLDGAPESLGEYEIPRDARWWTFIPKGTYAFVSRDPEDSKPLIPSDSEPLSDSEAQ